MADKKLSDFLPARTPLSTDLVPTLRSTDPAATANDISTIADMILLGQVGTSNGIDLTFTNPTEGGNSTNRMGVSITSWFDSTEIDPLYGNQSGIYNYLTALNGQYQYGGQTNAKTSFFNLYNFQYASAAGQRFSTADIMEAYGMGDAFINSKILTLSGGIGADGDEGQGFLTATMQNSPTNFVTTIVGVATASTIDTTTTQAVTGSKTEQTVTVVVSTGVIAGQWVVIDSSTDTDIEAVKLTAVAVGSITGIFRANHLSGATVKPATVLDIGSASGFGQKRPVINLSATPYNTGSADPTAASTTVVGSGGASWTTGMVGGTVGPPGYISFTDDNVVPSGDTIKTWFRITSVTNTTHLEITRRDILGEGGYPTNGRAAGGSNYTIRPGAKLLMFDGSNIVLETNTFTWTAGDSIECPQSPEADWSAMLMRFYPYVPGHYRAGINMFQVGYFDIENAIKIESLGTGIFNVGLNVAGTSTGVYADDPTGSALLIQTVGNNAGEVRWLNGSSGPSIGHNNAVGSGASSLILSAVPSTTASNATEATNGALALWEAGGPYKLRWNGESYFNGTWSLGTTNELNLARTTPAALGFDAFTYSNTDTDGNAYLFCNGKGVGNGALSLGRNDTLYWSIWGNDTDFNIRQAGIQTWLTITATTGLSTFAGTIDAAGYKAGGTAGVVSFGPSIVTSITVKNGIVTAIS